MTPSCAGRPSTSENGKSCGSARSARATWLAVWPEEGESPPILCRPRPVGTRKLRELDHAGTMRQYCLARLEEHLGEIKESKASCRKVNCDRRRLAGSTYCVEHLIAEQFGRYLAHLDEATPTPTPTTPSK